MLQFRHPAIQKRLFEGKFGLEKESLRLTRSGSNPHTPHPFNHPHIVCDFAANQTEINTPVCTTLDEALDSLESISRMMNRVLEKQGEVLWPFSSPGYIANEEDIQLAYPEKEAAHTYRKYLSGRYGRYKMMFSGIHFNFSFSDNLLMQQAALEGAIELPAGKNPENPEDLDESARCAYRKWKDRFYLQLTEKTALFGWLINALLCASPLVDGSYWQKHLRGQTCFTGTASLRCSEMGYWNFFTPVFDYSDMNSYTRSIEKLCECGMLYAPSELYYPVRIKPASSYSMESLRKNGADHIELRMIDLNPYEAAGISKDDARFCHLFLVYLACLPDLTLDDKQQILAAQNFKNAARYDLKSSRIAADRNSSLSVWQEALDFLEKMEAFYTDLLPQVPEAVTRQKAKLLRPHEERLAWKVREDFETDYMRQGLEQALHLQKQA